MSLIKEKLPEVQATATNDKNKLPKADCSLLIASAPFISALEKVKCDVLIYTGRFEKRFVLPAMRYGVKGYISTTTSIEDLISAIRAVLDGGCVYDKKVLQVVNSGCVHKPLNVNEKQLLFWLVKNYKEDRIAKILGCNVFKVQNLYKCLCSRLRCTTRSQALFIALKNGYIDFNEFEE